MRRTAAVAAAALALVLLAWPAAAKERDLSAQLKSAQARANKAAARLAAAETALARAERQAADLRQRTTAAQARLNGLQTQVRDTAVREYMTGGVDAIPIAGGDIGTHVRGEALLRHVMVGQTDAIDGYRAAQQDLEASKAALDSTLVERKSAASRLRKERSQAVADVSRLAAAQRELERKQAAAARARTGRAVPARASRAVGVIATGAWVCPVQGPRSFTDDFGDPRSGGRRHQGNDILAPRGTPVVASVAGTVRGHNSSLGGISYYLAGSDGNTYFGTHLSGLSGASGHVAAGTVIGYVGNSGNASGGPPHLHFEIHPGGGRAVNPYPTLVRYC